MAKTITTGDGTTHFVDINDRLRIVSAGPPVIALPPLKSGAIGAAMLFVPKAVFQVEQVPMLVYFHGHHGPNSIEGYVNQMPKQRAPVQYRYREARPVDPRRPAEQVHRGMAGPAAVADAKGGCCPILGHIAR